MPLGEDKVTSKLVRRKIWYWSSSLFRSFIFCNGFFSLSFKKSTRLSWKQCVHITTRNSNWIFA